MQATKQRQQSATTTEDSTDALPEHASNKPSTEEIKERDKAAEDILDEIDRVLDESAVVRAEAKRVLDDDLLDEIDSLLVADLAVNYVQAGGE